MNWATETNDDSGKSVKWSAKYSNFGECKNSELNTENLQLTPDQDKVHQDLNFNLHTLNCCFQSDLQIRPKLDSDIASKIKDFEEFLSGCTYSEVNCIDELLAKHYNKISELADIRVFLDKHEIRGYTNLEKLFNDKSTVSKFSEFVNLKKVLDKYATSLNEPTYEGANYIFHILRKASEIAHFKEFLESQDSEDLKHVLNHKVYGRAVLHSVADHYPEVTKILLEKGADPNIKDDEGKTPLHYAIEFNCPESMEVLLEKGADPDIKDGMGNASLHCTNIPKNIEILLDKGANPNIQANDGETPLHIAVRHDYQVNAKLLFDKGAKANIENNQGDTPFRSAIQNERHNIIELFIDCDDDEKVEINFKHRITGEPLIFDAVEAQKDNGELAELMIKSGKVDLGIKNSEGMTILHKAASFGRNDVVSLLIERGADIYATDINGRTPLHFVSLNNLKVESRNYDDNSRENGFDYGMGKSCSNITSIIDALIREHRKSTELRLKKMNETASEGKLNEEQEEYVNTRDKNGNAPLFYAIKSEKSDVVAKLLRVGARIDVVNKNGFTPFHYAIKSTNSEVLVSLTSFSKEQVDDIIEKYVLQDTEHIEYSAKLAKYSIYRSIIESILKPTISHYLNAKIIEQVDFKFIEEQVEGIIPNSIKKNWESCDLIKSELSKLVESVTNEIRTALSGRGG